MNKLSNFIILTILALVFFACNPIDDMFDETLLIGKWSSGTEFYRYDFNGKGATWDTSEDVSEAEAQGFTWTLVNADLTHIHIMETGSAGVPKIYTVTELTSTSLKYKDGFSKTYSFTKVQNVQTPQ